MAEVKNLTSASVKIFPTTLRAKTDPSSRMMTEYNLTSIVNRLTDRKSFVISSNDENYNFDLGRFEFNINGYYIAVSSVVDILKAINPDPDFDEYQKDTSDSTANYFWKSAEGKKNATQYIVAKITIQTDSTGGIKDISWNQLQGDDKANDDDGSITYSGLSFELSDEYIDITQITSDDQGNGIIGKTYPLSILELFPSTFEEGQNFTHKVRIPENSQLKFISTPCNNSITIDEGELN